MVTENPRGFSLAQKTEPPHCSMLFLMMASPRPEPPGCLRCASAPRKKGLVSEGELGFGHAVARVDHPQQHSVVHGAEPGPHPDGPLEPA